ncbi:hypothetical protein AVEN_261622-1 [Araneus ventricosus]|uniref:Uncharacterized protein n=1 Tax=Araneus ventricosus TaxID=182803 RepID=A0A4Y2KGH9_ARAVE|nr:hypothetical protein AVEN_261622-1 [Araneus ventricosus]
MDNSGRVMENTEGRRKISRLTNSRYYATVHHRDTFQPRCCRLTRGQNARSSSEFRFRIFKTNTTEIALRLLTSFHVTSLSFHFPSFLNTLPSKARGVVHKLPPGDSSSSWTNHPTTSVVG